MRTSHMGTGRRSGVKAAATAAVLALAVTACSSGDSDPRAAGGDSPISLGVRSSARTLLQEGQSCDEVLEDFQSFAPAVLRGNFGFGVEEDLATSDMALEAGATSGDDSAPSAPQTTAAATSGELGRTADGDSSDTNTQEAGIDEPDTVENDGDFVYVVDQQELVILDGATAEVLSRTPLASYGAQILLSGDRLLAITGGGGGFIDGPMPVDAIAVDDVALEDVGGIEPAPAPAPEERSDGEIDEPIVEPIPDPGRPIPTEPAPFNAGTVIQLLDLSDRSAPTVLETTEIEGHHIDTRVVDGVARIVVSS